MTTCSTDRRRFVTGLLATTAIAVFPLKLLAQGAEKLATTDPMAQALGYVPDASKVDPKADPTFKPGSTCAGCALYDATKEKDGYGPCGAFAGKLVHKSGWCKAFAAKG